MRHERVEKGSESIRLLQIQQTTGRRRKSHLQQKTVKYQKFSGEMKEKFNFHATVVLAQPENCGIIGSSEPPSVKLTRAANRQTSTASLEPSRLLQTKNVQIDYGNQSWGGMEEYRFWGSLDSKHNRPGL